MCSNTASEAEESLEKLHELVDNISAKIAESHNDIAVELRQLISKHHNGPLGYLPRQDDRGNGSASDRLTTQTIASSLVLNSASVSDIDFDDGASFRTTATSISLRSIRSIRFRLPLYNDKLKKFRTYKRLWRRGVDPDSQSVVSKDSRGSKVEGESWSMLSDLSLGDLSISEVSVLELPISLSDLYDPAPYQVARGHRRQKPLPRSVRSAAQGGLIQAINKYFAFPTMLTLGADIDQRSFEDRTSLSYAAQNGQLRACQMLLEKGPAVDSEDRNGRTPLSYAATNNDQRP